MSADVIEVDFEARRLAALPIREQVNELRRAIDVEYAWVERQWQFEQARADALQRTLLKERGANFPFSDDQVLDAAHRAAYTAGTPVAAAAIADALCGRGATHSAVVRVGLALSRLRAAGEVRGAVPPDRRHATRWEPTDASDLSD